MTSLNSENGFSTTTKASRDMSEWVLSQSTQIDSTTWELPSELGKKMFYKYFDANQARKQTAYKSVKAARSAYSFAVSR